MSDATEVKLYKQNVLSGFDNGCLLDLRVRLAIEFIKASRLNFDIPAEVCACYALDLASEVLSQADAKGLIEPLPDGSAISAEVRAQAGRMARFNVVQQLEMQRAAQDESDRVAAVPSFIAPRSAGH